MGKKIAVSYPKTRAVAWHKTAEARNIKLASSKEHSGNRHGHCGDFKEHYGNRHGHYGSFTGHYGSDREYDWRFTEQEKSLASGAKICGFPAETSIFLTKTAISLVHSRRAPRKVGFASAATNITVAATDITVTLVNITVPPANIAVPPVNTEVAPKNSTVVTTNITS